MNKKYGIFNLIGFLVMLGFLFDWFGIDSGSNIPSFIYVFVGLSIFSSIFRNITKKTNNTSGNQSTYEQSNRFDTTNRVTIKQKQQFECEYCNHKNDPDQEYCENCGARILKY